MKLQMGSYRMRRRRQTAQALDALLISMLNRSELSGYELATLLKEPIPLIWPVRHSQIYPALAELEAEGDILGTWIEQKGRPSMKRYGVTGQGRERLVNWLCLPRASLTEQETILIAYNYRLVGLEAATAALRTYRTQTEREIAQLEGRWSALTADRDLSEWTGPGTAFEFGIGARRARLAWCDWAIDRITDETVP